MNKDDFVREKVVALQPQSFCPNPCTGAGQAKDSLWGDAGGRRQRAELAVVLTGGMRSPSQSMSQPEAEGCVLVPHLQYYLKMEPGLFKGAVESQLQRMKEEKEEKEAAAKEQDNAAGDGKELTLYKLVVARAPLPMLMCDMGIPGPAC
jgi:hypothetical protein